MHATVLAKKVRNRLLKTKFILIVLKSSSVQKLKVRYQKVRFLNFLSLRRFRNVRNLILEDL